MKKFIQKIVRIIVIPSIVFIAILIYWDPFKVYFSYDDYYTNNRIKGNREDVCLHLFNRLENKNEVTNFIVGNSRSQAFKTSDWKNYLGDSNGKCFHYDGSGFGLFRANNAIKYLSNSNDKIENILLIIDTEFLKETSLSNEHIFIQPPAVSNESKLSYYSVFFKSSINLNFIACNLIYTLSGGKYFEFMKNHISRNSHDNKSNNETGDVWYPYDEEILNDSIGYYENLLSKNVFYDRPKFEKSSEQIIGKVQLNMLNQIKQIVSQKNIKIKIVVSHLYNQEKLHEHDLETLNSIFGEWNVFDFSGKNEITDDFRNYYEASHYKPYIAERILEKVYSGK